MRASGRGRWLIRGGKDRKRSGLSRGYKGEDVRTTKGGLIVEKEERGAPQSFVRTELLADGLVNWCSVTPLPIAAVLLTPPVTVMSRLSTNSAPDH
jgi:hypothetical protein